MGGMNVFAYGTLMYPEVWRTVVGQSHATVSGRLAGHSIYRVCDAVFPGIVLDASGGPVVGVVHLDIDSEVLERLDRFEDDFYCRELVTIDCDDGLARQAFAYVVPQEYRHVLTSELWSNDAFIAQGGLEQFVSRFAGFGRVEGA
jgi:gamma-glutamylcyclotransferase (GGCT)/AIG2-like uncharacterized protein YtfP